MNASRWNACFALPLVAAALCAGCKPGSGVRTGVDPLRASRTCEAPQWAAGTSYQQGDQVQNLGQLYSCKQSAWCSQEAYAPGNSADPTWWPQAWDRLDACVEPEPGFEGNRLVLKFPAAPLKTTRAGISGLLRCPGETPEEHPINAAWSETLNIDGLKRCDYHLIMDVVDGQTPVNTPELVKFSEEEGQSQEFLVEYSASVSIADLVALPGLKIELFAQGLMQPRQMTLGQNMLYVGSSALPNLAHGSRIADFIYALPLNPGTGRPTAIHLLATGLHEPHGVAFRQGDLFYSSTGSLYRVSNVDATYTHPQRERVMSFPADDVRFALPPVGDPQGVRRWHQKHPLHFNPTDPNDDGLYTAVGIPCNICMIQSDERYGSILRYDLSSGESAVLARGVRNSVGFDWHPDTHQIWFSDNNRQSMDNPDEINRISRENEFFGVPYVFGKDTLGFTAAEYAAPASANDGLLVRGAILSDLRQDEIDVRRQTVPSLELEGGSAPLGVTFWAGYPDVGTDRAHLLVAVHGGAGEGNPSVRMLTIADNKIISDVPLITGWNKDGKISGRPTDFLELPDGSLLISDDVAGVIYRVSYDPEGLPETQVSLTAATAPDPSIAGERLSGVLTDPQGKQRGFQMSWGDQSLVWKGLAFGEYEVRLEDVGIWAPVTRTTPFTLSADVPTTSIAISYQARPEVFVDLKINAPAKPSGVAIEKWQVTLAGGDGEPRELQIDWGGSTVERLSYGNYQVKYPYYVGQLPEPSLDEIAVNEESPPDKTVTTAYRTVTHVGEAMLNGPCATCHVPSEFDDPGKAFKWDNSGIGALTGKILDMSNKISGHCEGTCAQQTASYLMNTVWAKYLNPGTPYAVRQLRQLTPNEYVNSIQDLFAVAVDPGRLPADKSEKYFKFPGQAERGILQKDDVYRYYEAARSIAAQVDLEAIGYDPDADPAPFISALGRKIFRRPLTATEQSRYRVLLETADEGKGGPRQMIAGMLLSPHFLYRFELGAPESGKADIYKLSPYEVAAALSFTFLGTTPSPELLDKAADGDLETSEQIAAEISDMMTSERGLAQFQRFVRYYVKTIGSIDTKEGLTQPVIDSMLDEQALFTRYVLRDGGGTVNELFNPGYTFLNQDLAGQYQISGVTGPDMRKVDLTSQQKEIRGGLLHQGALHTTLSDAVTSGLIRRGFALREQLFCHEFGTPIADPRPPAFPDYGVTTRHRWDLVNGRYADSTCWTCHKFVNDTGASLENYDAAGRYRLQEFAVNPPYTDQLVDIDAAGDFLDSTGSGDWGYIQDVRGIAHMIPDNTIAMNCFAESYLRYAYGSKPDAEMMGLLLPLRQQLLRDGSLQEMMRSIGTSNAFTHRKER